MAVHSSSALCVNNFALIKQHKDNVMLFGESGFYEATFEKKFPTGLRGKSANLDFYLENEKSRIGIESKFTETLKPELPNKDRNLEPYRDHEKLPEEMRKSFNEVIECYMNKDKMLLDVAQLIKHSIAMSLYACENKGKKTKLIYLYWLPTNHKDIDIYQQHEKELKTFKDQIKKCQLPFEPYSYLELWDMMEEIPVLSGILKKIRARYEFSIKI